MKFRKLLEPLRNGQKGFTLIELIVVLAITGLIGLGATTAIVQVLSQSSKNNNYTTASRHTMNAIHWISRDAQMAQDVEPGGPAGFPLTLSWTEWDNTGYQVTYSIVDDKLRRGYSVDGGDPSETLVAQYINSTSETTSCEFAGGVLTLQVTTTVGEGTQELSVTKVREITPRPSL